MLEGYYRILNKFMEKLKGFKTILFTVIVGLFAYLETTDMTGLISEERMPFAVVGVVIVNLVLRAISNTKIGKSE